MNMLKLENLYESFRKGDVKINGIPFCEAGISGENRNSHLGAKLVASSEEKSLRFISCEGENNDFVVTLKNERTEVKAKFCRKAGINGFSVNLTAKNVTKKPLVIENLSFALGLGKSVSETDKIYFTRFLQSHHAECQPRTRTLFDEGISALSPSSQIRVSHANVGSWSTKEELPQGIIFCGDEYLAFQIESNDFWYYEISDYNGVLYLLTDGGNEAFGGVSKTLLPNEEYKTETFSFFISESLNGVLKEMTEYRRLIAGKCAADENLPTIFNEYMHLSWDSPEEERTRKLAKEIAKLGVKYYVIDCGWHNEEAGNIVYPYVGQWKESKARFPHGVRATTDYIRSLKMKAGLWIEPEVVGYKCEEMTEFYDDDCFIKRNGEKVCVQGRYFLDFRNEKVRGYMTETIRRMVENYGADYIKTDYNQDVGAGADDADGFGTGYKKCSAAYLRWIDEMRKRFPSVIFEGCSSGGMRTDYKTLSRFSVVSTSDQTDYKKYPYIAANVLAAATPEQAAVWSYPVEVSAPIGTVCEPTEEWVKKNISEERVVMNMINSFLGRMHLASRVNLLPDDRLSLVKEGIEYYDSLSEVKKRAYPYMPEDFADFGKKQLASGFICGKKIYLAVWKLGGAGSFSVAIKEGISKVKVGYPESLKTNFTFGKNSITVKFDKDEPFARFFEIDIL